MTLNLIALTFIASLSLSQIQSCQNHTNSEKDEVREVFSLDSKVELLFLFQKGASKAAKDDFYENILNQPHPGGGYWPRDGVKATFGIDRMGYEGFGIKFQEGTRQEQKQEIKRLIEASPVVYRVYENVVPNDINDL